jgi:hypothetical protein
MAPLGVVIVALYSFVASICIAGGALYTWTSEGWSLGCSAAPNVLPEQRVATAVLGGVELSDESGAELLDDPGDDVDVLLEPQAAARHAARPAMPSAVARWTLLTPTGRR